GKFQLSYFFGCFNARTNFSGWDWSLGRSSQPNTRGKSRTNKDRRSGDCGRCHFNESVEHVHFAYSTSVHLDVEACAPDCDHRARCTHLEWWRSASSLTDIGTDSAQQYFDCVPVTECRLSHHQARVRLNDDFAFVGAQHQHQAAISGIEHSISGKHLSARRP